MTTKDLIKNFFIKSGGLISSKRTKVYQQGKIIYNSNSEKLNIWFSSIDHNRKYIINNLNKIIDLTIIDNTEGDYSCYDYFFPLPPK